MFAGLPPEGTTDPPRTPPGECKRRPRKEPVTNQESGLRSIVVEERNPIPVVLVKGQDSPRPETARDEGHIPVTVADP